MLILFVSLWVSVGFANEDRIGLGQKPQLIHVARLVKNGRYPLAIRQARRGLAIDPSATGMRALLGIALVRSGLPERGLKHLDDSVGTRAYVELGGFGAHAEAVRAVGVGNPWFHRQRRLDPELSDRQTVQTLTQGVDDLLAIGDTSGAILLGEQAVMVSPTSPAAHAFLATARLQAGDVEGAEYHHWLSRRTIGRRVARVAVNEAVLAELHGDQWSAQKSWERLEVIRRSDSRIAAWHAGWLRRQGQLSQAKARAYSVETVVPELLVERIRVSALLGDRVDAMSALDEFERRFPVHPALPPLRELVQ